MLARSLLVLLAAIAAVGCGYGAMQQSRTVSEGAADKGGLASSLDAPLAVGGEVRPSVKIEVPGSAPPATHLISARPDIVDVRQGLLVGKSPGMSAVLVTTDGDTVLDFFHVTVRAADRLEVHGIDASGADLGPLTEPVELMAGDGMRLVPHGYAGDQRLVGVGTSTWTVEPPIAVTLREGLPNRVRLVARAAGNATVKVTMLGATTTLDLKVTQ